MSGVLTHVREFAEFFNPHRDFVTVVKESLRFAKNPDPWGCSGEQDVTRHEGKGAAGALQLAPMLQAGPGSLSNHDYSPG